MEKIVSCKDYHKLIAAFDRHDLDYESTLGFVRHVSECDDCKEEYEIFNIAKYALSEDDGELDRELEREPEGIRGKIAACDYKGLVVLRLKEATLELDRIRKNELCQVVLLLMTEVCALAAATMFLWERLS